MGADSRTAPVMRVAQITDTHLHADPEGCLMGLNTRACLDRVVALARRRAPAAVIATGDLTHDGDSQAYRQLQTSFGALHAPVYCLPGNHDRRDTLREVLDGGPCYSPAHVRLDAWEMAFVDTTVPGSDAGHIDTGELDRLDAVLAQAPERPAIVWLHHQPVPVGSRWLDTMAIDNAESFFSVVDRHPQVRAVVWGHVHQEFESRRKQVALLATPSTCVQFMPGSETFEVQALAPGYRWFELRVDGSFATGVERLEAIPNDIDLQQSGY